MHAAADRARAAAAVAARDDDLDVDAGYDPAVPRRASLAALRREEAALIRRPLDGAGAAIAGRVGVDPASVTIAEAPAVAAAGAQAVTRGDAIDFAPGAYVPDTARGQALLGHELAHVVQQRGGARGVQPRLDGPDPTSSLEREADAVGAAVARGDSVAGTIRGRATPSAPQYSFDFDASATAAAARSAAGDKPSKKAKPKTGEPGTAKTGDHSYRLWGFREDSSEVPDSFQDRLDAIAASIPKSQEAAVFVYGHTDADEDAALGARRADVIKLVLESKGLRGKTFVTSGLGATSPLVDESREGADAARNRRVEITVVPGDAAYGHSTGKSKVPAPDPSAVPGVADTADFWDAMDKATDRDPVLGPMWRNVKDADYMAGLAVGAAKGVYKAAKEIHDGPKELAKLVQELITTLIDEGIIDFARSIVDGLSDALDAVEQLPEALTAAFQDFAHNWTTGSSYDVGHFRGKVVGYLAVHVGVFLLSVWAGSGAAQVGRFAEIAGIIDGLSGGGTGRLIAFFAGKSKKLAKLFSRFGRSANAAGGVGDEAGDAAKVVPDAPAKPQSDISDGDSAAVGRRILAKETVELNGHEHTLRLADDGSLWLCSDCTFVKEKIEEVLRNAPEHGPEKSLRKRLEKLHKQVVELEERIRDGSTTHVRAPKELNRIAGHLRDMSEKYPSADPLCVFCGWAARLDYDALAKHLGFERIAARSHGQPVYQKDNIYISRDIDRHRGGVWKMAKGSPRNLAPARREGTFNWDLTEKVGP